MQRTNLEVKDDREAKYEARVAEYKSKTEGMSSLYKHIYYCLDSKSSFSAHSVATKLTAMHASSPGGKGVAIAYFNAIHSGNYCPFFKNTKVEKNASLGIFLHLGTTRVWKADGSVDPERLTKLIDNVADEKQTLVTKSKLHAYLAKCADGDPDEKETGRNTASILSSKSMQVFAATSAWDEVFDRLAGGWILTNEKTAEMEPYLTIDVFKDFFWDSPLAYLKAECGLLPAPKPKIEARTAPTMAA